MEVTVGERSEPLPLEDARNIMQQIILGVSRTAPFWRQSVISCLPRRSGRVLVRPPAMRTLFRR